MIRDNREERPMTPTHQRLDFSSPNSSSGNIHYRVINEGNEKRVLSFQTTLKLSFGENTAEDSPWTCDKCQYENADTSNKICSICGHKRDRHRFRTSKHEQYISDIPENGSQWDPLKSLTLSGLEIDKQVDNDPLETSLTRSMAEISFGQGTGWTCPDCTFVNTSPLHLACYVCAKKKPHNSFECSITKAFDLKLPEISVLESQIKEYQNYENIAIEAANLSHIIEDQMTVFKAIEKEGRKHSNLDLKELHWILDEGAASLKRLNKLYKEDRKKYDKTVEYQAQKEIMIAAKEGCKPSSTMYAEAKPGVQHISPAILEWQGQQRMLDDWKIQLDERQSEMTSLQAYHQKTLNRILS
mmetsp:Transcript_32349/g.49186  ORF Transcript_32349/g.49186 Transcript_32349/m.49186 type:complete len:356 (-) Transcript_32349:143-1210(-)